MQVYADEVVINIPMTQGKEFTSYLFYEEFLPQITEYRINFDKYKYKDLILDFYDVKKINPIVIPNLLCIGEGLKKLRRIITVIRNLSGDAAGLLGCSNFKELAERRALFKFQNFDLGNVGWLGENKIKIYLNYIDFSESFRKFYEVDFEMQSNLYQSAVNYILDKINEDDDDARKIFENMKEQIEAGQLIDLAETMNNEIALTFNNHKKDVNLGLLLTYLVESVKNSIMHGLAGCFVLAYTSKFKHIEKCGIAVSDIGKGIMKSINEKYERSEQEENKFIFKDKKVNVFDNLKKLTSAEKENLTDNYTAILEALFYRTIKRPAVFRYYDCGLYDVVKSILKSDKNGIIRIHSENVQVKFTNDFYNKHIEPFIISDKDKKIDWEKLSDHLRKHVVADDEQYSNIITTNFFGGSHLEYEFHQDLREV